MTRLILLALVAVALLSGCIAYPVGSYQGGGERGYGHDGHDGHDRHDNERRNANGER